MCRPCSAIEENSIIPQELVGSHYEDGSPGLIRKAQLQK